MKLYEHQEVGANWLAQQTRAGLLDCAGMGKTPTAIVAADKADVGTVLVLAPTVVAWNWEREVRRWTARPVYVVAASNDLPPNIEKNAVVIVTHGLLIRGRVYDWIRSFRWGLVILDEAHGFRNREAQRTRAFYGTGGVIHHAERVWLLTGTIVPNNCSELWTHLRGLWPDRCNLSFDAFLEQFCVTEWSPFSNTWKVIGNKNLAGLKAMMSGLFLRRTKEDHLDLPPIRWETVVLPPAEADPLLTYLNETLRDLIAGYDNAEALDLLRQHKEFAAYRRLCGIAKVPTTIELLEQDALPKTVVFVQHLSVVDGLTKGLGERCCVALTGASSASDRTRMIDRFQNDPSVRYAICQLQSASVGITLTAASEVVFVEQSFVPAENAQAADRCHRIGQDQSVRVRVLALANTVDQLVAEILARKSAAIKELGFA